ncbi:hypothetical protein PR048_028236 [Dryococelus australis]|uniref:Integrase catalytic domain-containing protein n=1 Tax=Dryococelus australis TaxID=614101 RepID=A0ABQ9GIL4_9NEOP|nr:hypothetical protein PR048_028236 [Dryococelus australis]
MSNLLKYSKISRTPNILTSCVKSLSTSWKMQHYKTKYIHNCTCQDKNKAFIEEVGMLKCVLSDKGTQFTSELWQSGLRKWVIIQTTISICHPQSNPVER